VQQQTEDRPHLRVIRGTEYPPRTVEVLGQCQCCHDMFSVLIFKHKGQLLAHETSSLHLVKVASEGYCLVHKQGICNGEVKLYGSETWTASGYSIL
jgi:hypothetical protein